MAIKKVSNQVVDTATGEVLGVIPDLPMTALDNARLVENRRQYDQYMQLVRDPYGWKTPYNHDRDAEAARTATGDFEPTKTQQNQAEEADINTIVNRFLKTGTLPQIDMPPLQGDFEEAFDLQTSLELVHKANQSFMALPANVRSEFGNDPAKFVAYCDHCMETGDTSPLEKLGLTVKKQPPQPSLADQVAEAITRSQEPPAPPEGPPGALPGGRGAPRAPKT